MTTLRILSDKPSKLVSVATNVYDQTLHPRLHAKVYEVFTDGKVIDTQDVVDFWEYAVSLPDRWQYIPATSIKHTLKILNDLAADCQSLANKLLDHNEEVNFVFGPNIPLDFIETTIEHLELLGIFLKSDPLERPELSLKHQTTSPATAERLFIIRSLTLYLLHDLKKSESGLVALMTNALLDTPEIEHIDSKFVRDCTSDIIKNFRNK